MKDSPTTQNWQRAYLAFKKIYIHLTETDRIQNYKFSKENAERKGVCVWQGAVIFPFWHQENFNFCRFVFTQPHDIS